MTWATMVYCLRMANMFSIADIIEQQYTKEEDTGENRLV